MNVEIQSSKCFLCLIKKAIEVIQVANVCLHQQGAAAQGFNAARGFFCGSTVAKEINDYICAIAGEVLGNHFSDSAPGACDQYCFVLKEELWHIKMA